MRTIIAGSRTFTDYETLCRFMTEYAKPITEVVSGGANCVDKLGEKWANDHDIAVKRFLYESKYGNAGGPIRNKKMAEIRRGASRIVGRTERVAAP